MHSIETQAFLNLRASGLSEQRAKAVVQLAAFRFAGANACPNGGGWPELKGEGFGKAIDTAIVTMGHYDRGINPGGMDGFAAYSAGLLGMMLEFNR